MQEINKNNEENKVLHTHHDHSDVISAISFTVILFVGMYLLSKFVA
ncbi:MAG: hypothetical protein PHV37_00945 [Candidatus Gastranaerophilales bacterium]|nr:hypothetical protein [Candidatus Gastranaerophilales bacterium]